MRDRPTERSNHFDHDLHFHERETKGNYVLYDVSNEKHRVGGSWESVKKKLHVHGLI